MKKSLPWFILILLLTYQHLVLFQTDMKMWFLNNFFISGLAATYCFIKAIQALRGKKDADIFN